MSDPTLTRTVQVLEVLRAGGHVRIEAGHEGPVLMHLHRADGTPAPAWQTAINTALRKGGAIKTDSGMTDTGAWARWDLPHQPGARGAS